MKRNGLKMQNLSELQGLQNNQLQRMKLHLKVLLLTLLIACAFSLKGIGLNPIKPYHLNQGKSTTYLFSISPEEEVLTKAKIRITFPFEFNHARLASNLSCMAKSSSYAWKTVPCEYSNPAIIITLDTIKEEPTYVLVAQPVNPVIHSMSSYFTVCLMYDNTVTSCNKEFGKVVFPSSPASNNEVVTPSVQSLNSNTVGQASTYQFTFGMSSFFGMGNTIRVKFPPGFTTTESPICQLTGTFNQVIRTFVWPDKRSIECENINSTFVANEPQVLKIIGIFNPKYAGNFQGFVIEMLRGSTTISLQQIYPPNQIQIVTGGLVGRIQQQNNFIKSNTRYTFYLTLLNPLTSNDYIQIKFPTGWTLYNGQCTAISGLTMNGRTLRCVNSTGQHNTFMKINNFQSASVSNQIVLSILVGTPSIPGDYSVQTITGNDFGIMDKMTTTIRLNATYGTIDMLSINAITANAKVAVGKTGPLELTFFLNYMLPQTNVLTQGKFIMKIYPRIMLPDPMINGVLKCYFLNNIPAKTCIWDDTESVSYTKVTITTPQTLSFQYSQIPITLTTEGAVNDSMIGITIADVVTRYRFQLEAFKQENATTPTEVYYTQYIADAISFPVTTYSLTNEMNDYTHLRLQFVGPYDFTASVVKDIRFKIEFLNSGWAANLGYQPNQIYKRFPCVLSESTAYPPTYNNKVVCDLYTYLDGPHASLTDPASRGPYILMYGFHPSLAKNTNYRLQLGKFLIGSSSNIDTKIRFSIIQETPNMLTPYVELYFNELSLFSTAVSGVTLQSNTFTTSMSNSQINVANHHSHSYAVPSNGLAIIYEYDQSSTQSFTNQNFQCTSDNWCVALGYPVNWIIEYKQSGTHPTSIASSIYFVNGVYADTFQGKVRVFRVVSNTVLDAQTKNIMTSLYKATFTYAYTPSLPTSTSFTIENIIFGTVYKNMEQYYLITFYPSRTLPSNGFIRLTLSIQMKFSPVPYCHPTDLPVLDANLGLQCTLEDSRSTLKVFNIGTLGAGGRVQIRVRIATELSSSSSISPSIRIRTFRTLTIDTSLVDERAARTLSSSPHSNLYTNPISFEIDNPRTVPETPRVNYIGKLQIKFRPSSSAVSTPASKIRVYFHDHPWNSGKFTTPNNNVADPLVCKLNGKRVACTYTLNPFDILMNINPAGLNAGSDNIITLDTEYIAPDNGIKHPSQAGSYMTTLHFYDSSASINEIQKASFTHQIKAIKLRNLVITSTVHDVGVQNMFKVDFQTYSSRTVNANYHETLYSRIFIEFPTKDSLGNNLFADDLGGYRFTGEYVGCHFSFPNGSLSYVKKATSGDYMRCRLIKSEVERDPVRVEVINHGPFTSSTRWMTIYIAKVFNPAIAVTSVPISVRIQHVDAINNNVFELYHDTYDVFMNSQNPTLQESNTTRGTRSDTFENGKDIGDQGVIAFDVRKKGSVGITTSLGYYMALDLTDSMKPMNNQNQTAPARYCNGSYFHACWVFPQINYVVIWAYSNSYYSSVDVQIPESYSQVDTYLVSRVWQNGRFMGFDHIQLYASDWVQIKGDLTSVSFVTIGNTWERAAGRRRIEMMVTFYTDNGIPAGGSIEIVWPSGVPKAYPHCRSMISQGSVLTAQGQTSNGEIGCMVQNTRNWVITSFQAVPQNAKIVIVGQIDMIPNANAWIGTRYIYTYNNTHPTDIRTHGKIRDYYGASPSDIATQNSISWNVDSEITVQQTLTLRTNYVGPLQFKIQLNQNFLGPRQGRIVIRVFKKSTILQANGFAYVDKKYVCKIVQLQTNEQTGCTVERVDDDNTNSNQNIRFTLFTSSNLLSSAPYQVTLTTQEGVQPEGLTFPTSPGTYKVSVSVDADSNTAYNIYNHLYLQVYGTSFKVLKMISMNTRPNEQNLIWIRLTPNTQIQTTEQIIIDFPTKSTSGLQLFQDDLGTGLGDGEDIKIDVIGGDFSNTFMKCRLFWGDSTFSKSTKIVCGAFQSAISTTQLLFFAIKFNNPALNGGRTHISYPMFIYSMQQGKTFKKNFNVYDHAVNIRNDNGYNRDYAGDITTSALQTPNGNINMISRNYWEVTTGQYYILFFGFPLRRNGIVNNGCSWPGGAVYGNAYYHQNIWAIVCEVTSTTNSISSNYAWNDNNVFNGNTRNLRISGFYTPWYLLSNTQRIVTTYLYRTGDITARGIFTDLYPNAGPKQGSGPTFTMTPVHHTGTQIAGARDDYTFEIIYSSSASNDISYMKRIAIIFPNPASEGIDFVLVGQDCVEATGSQVQIEQCWIETGGRVIWIRPVVKTSYTSNMRIRIQTRDLAIRNPTNNRTVYWNRFVVKFYSWQNKTEPSLTPLSNDNQCFLIINNINNALVTTYGLNPGGYSVPTFDYINYPHQRYFEETPYQALIHRAPIELKFRPSHDFIAQSSQYHNIRINYPASFGDVNMFKIRDLEVFRPVCYLNNFRIRRCTIDTTSNFISMEFMFALTNNVAYQIKVSLIDPRNPDVNGFLASTAITDLVLTYRLAGQAITYYIESDQFPTLFTLPTGITGGPFRGIVDGSVEYGHYIVNQLNSINLLLTFNRTDITGLVFEIPLRDSAGTYLYPTTANFNAAFLNLQNGATYPCGNNGFGAGGNPKCIILNGDNTKEGVSTKIIMTDFTYNTIMNCRFIFTNPQTNGAYFSVKVKAYGGTRTATNLYGDRYMGEWNFMDIFQTTTGTVASNSYSRSLYRRATQSPWRNNTEEYVFSQNYAMYAGRMSLAQVLIYDDSSTRIDKQFCEANLGSSNNYDDLLEYTIVSGGITKKYAYFVTTWQGTTNVSYTGSVGWSLKYLKCRYYQQSYKAYWFIEKNSIEIATNTHDLNYPGTYGSITSPTVKYFDQSRRFSDSTATWFTMEIDFTATLNSITNFEFRSRDAMVLLVTISDGPIWNNIQSCQLLGGIISTSEESPASCERHSSTQIRIINVAGFQSNAILAAATNKRVKFVFKVDYLNGQAQSSDPTKITSSYLYANCDALSNGLQPIFAQSSTLLNNCQYPNNICYYSYGAGGGSGGTFTFDSLSDTSLRVSFKPVSHLDFLTHTVYNHYFRLQFHGFGFGSGCSISNVVAEITNSATPIPGSGWNNTLDFDTKTCNDNWIDIYWTTNRMFSENWGRVGLAQNNTWNTTFYIILYLIIVPGSSQDLPVMDHDYIFMSGTYNYQYSTNSWQDQVRNNAYLPIQTLAASASVNTLTDTREAVTQLIMEVKSLKVNLGSTNNNYFLLAEFIGTSSWTSANDPFRSYTNTAKNKQLIECKCLSGVGPLSSSTSSPYVDAKCYRRLPGVTVGSGTFANFAILIDHPVLKTHDIKCYFPEFHLSTGMSLNVKFKRIYGDSYPIDIISGTSEYFSMFTVTAPTVTYAGTIPSMSNPYVYGWNSLSDNSYLSAVTVGTMFNGIYTLSGNWNATLASPYLYLNLFKAGPIPVFSFCSDSNVYFECRVYTKMINLVVARFKSTSASSFSMTQGSQSLFYPSSQSSVSSFNGYAYVGTTSWQRIRTFSRTKQNLAPILTNHFSVFSDKYGSSRFDYGTNIFISMNINGQILYNYIETGSRIEVTFNQVTIPHLRNCQVWVQNEMNVELTCVVTAGKVIVFSRLADYSTSNNIFVSLGITNPNTASATFRMVMYDYYYSASRFSTVINRATMYTTDMTYSFNTRLEKSRIQVYPFKSRMSMTTNVPLRVRLNLPTSPGSITFSGHGSFVLTNTQFSASSKFLCYFKEYTSWTNMIQETEYGFFEAAECTASGSALSIKPPKTMTVNHNNFYELVMMPVGISSGARFNQAGFHQTNFEDINIVAYQNTNSGPSISAQQVNKLYQYEGNTQIGLQFIYYLSGKPNTETSLYIQFSIAFSATFNYPQHYFEIILFEITDAAFVGYAVNEIIPCQLSNNFLSIYNRIQPQCRLASADNFNNYIKVRIQNIGNLVVGNYWVTFDDIMLPVVSGGDSTKKFDISIGYYRPAANIKYENNFKEILVMDGTNSSSATTLPSLSFANPATNLYGAPVVGTMSFTWPFNTMASDFESKISININGGFASSWSNIDTLTFTDPSLGTYQILWVNKKLNKFVFKIPNKSSGSATMSINNIRNPYPYQQTPYNNIRNVQMNVYNNYFVQVTQNVSQPLFSIYQRNPSIIYINQNLPTNTIDNYPTAERATSNGLVKLTLSVAFDQNTPNIILRQLDVIDITFTSGLTYIEECRAMKNDSTFANPLTTCQTFHDGTNWHVKLYDITGSSLEIDWWIHVFAKLTSATLAYTFQISPKNLVPEYLATYSTVLTSYDATKIIPTQLSWLNRKYVPWFYETQVKLLEPNANAFTPYFKFRFNTPIAFDGGSDYFYFYLNSLSGSEPFRSKTESSSLICSFLPSISSQRDFTVGYFSQCNLQNTGNEWRWRVAYIHGGLPQGDYLFQLVENNIIDSAFYLPTSPTRTLIRTHLYRSQGNSNHYDSFYINSYRYFRKAEVVHTTTTVSDYDTLKVTYTPKGALPIASTNRQIVLRLSVHAQYLDNSDGGIKSIFLDDKVSIESGHRFSEVVNDPSNNQVTTIQFAQYSNNMAPLRFALAKQKAYVDNVEYVWRIPLLKNPSTAYVSLRYNLTLMEYPSSTNYGIIFNHYEIINDYFTEPDASTSFTTSVINNLRDVQTVSGTDLSISLGVSNVATWDSVTFKLDKSKDGLIPSFDNCNDTTNYDYYHFHTLEMVLAQKKSAANTTTVGINALSSTRNYQSTFSFKWVKLFDTSDKKQRFNPVTLRFSVPPTLTLTPFTSYSSAALTAVQGFEIQGSTVYYKILITTKIVTQGGEIRVMFDSSKFSSDVIGGCRVGTGFVKSTSQKQALRCYRGLNGFVISGFHEIAAPSSLQIFFYMKSTVAVTNSDISVDIYGIFRDNSTRISNSVIQQISHTSNPNPTNLQRVQQTVTSYYRSWYDHYSQHQYYQIEGSFTLRANNLAGSSTSIYFTDPAMEQWGDRRMLVKKNSSTVTGWTEMILDNPACVNQCRWFLPNNFINTLTFEVGQEYIWRYTTQYYNKQDTSRQNGYYFQTSGTQLFFLKAHTGSTWSEWGYEEFIPKYKPITYTLSNRYPAAGKQTILDIQFSVDIDLQDEDQIQLTFDTNNLLLDMFEPDLEGNTTNQTFRYLDCREWISTNNISTSRIVCMLFFGERTANPPKPAKLIIKTTRSFNGYPNIYSMRLLVANIRNPSTVGMNTGVELNINRACINSENQKCPYYTARGYYVTTSDTQNLPTTTATFSTNGNIVLQSSRTHTFVIPLSSSLTSSGIIYIVYPQNYQGVMPNDCSANNGFTCVSFPTRRWIVLYPSSTHSGSTVSIQIWNMRNGYYAEAFDNKYKITVSRPGVVGDVFYITAAAHQPITSGISMSISATQTPDVWLRNYANTAIFYINNIFNDDRIKAIYIKAPNDVTGWTYNYCNASITTTLINTYPLRFECKVDETDSSFLKITRHAEQLTWSGSWASDTIQVHAKFTLTGFQANQPILYQTMPNNTGLFYAYGSVNTTSPISKYYLSQTSQLVSISQHQVPIISEITFNDKSFAYRVARVNNKQVFYLLLRPTVGLSPQIGEMVFKVPDEFDYPGVFSHDNCFMLGRTKEDQPLCKQSRERGQTLIKLTPSNYDQQVKIIQLGSKSTANWFTAPALPGDFYNMTVELYSTSNVLLEKQTIDISPVYGEYFDIPSIQLRNIQEANFIESVYDFTFVTGTLQIPPGARTRSTSLTSELQFVFENYNAANSSNVFANDLKTGLKQGAQVGCVIEGIRVLENMRLKCLLHIGTNSTDKPMISVINYDFINPGTTIKISFAAIQSLMAPLSNTISIGVKMFYNDVRNSSTYLYILTPVLPRPTYALTLDSTRTTGWNWEFQTAFSGPNVVLQPTTFTMRMRVPRSSDYNTYQYSSTAQQDEFILLKFTPKFIIDPFNKVNIECSPDCPKSEIDIFYATGIIRFRHTRTLSGFSNFYFTFTNFPTASYAVTNFSISVVAEIYEDYRRVVQSPTMTYNRTVEKCTKFDFGVLSVSSLNGGQVDVDYMFSLKTNHYIPPNGAVSITLPSSYGNMVTSNATCTLIGFQDTNAYCRIHTPSRIDIYLNGSQLSQNISYKIEVKGLQNPNEDSSKMAFMVSSYFENDIYQSKIICENQITPPTINVKNIRECTLEWKPNFSNMYFNATYEFYVSCADQFRANSIAYIKLPSEFSTRNREGVQACTSYESATLLENSCTLRYINGSLVLFANLDATSQTSFSIITNFVNPINNTYRASVFVMSRGVKYAETNEDSLTILSNSYLSARTNDVFLLNNPKEGGLMSTYIFKITPIKSFDPENMALTFPNVFNLNPSQLSIGLCVTQVSNLFQQLTYDNIQRLINNVSSVAGVSLKLYPTFEVVGNTIFVRNITGQLSTNMWTYVLARGIKNPSAYAASNFTIAYYIESVQHKTLRWVYNFPLKYFISPPPNFITIEKVEVSDYDLLYPSVYTFTFSSNDGHQVAIANKRLSYVIVMPTFYKSTLWANTDPVCKFANLATNSTCYSYESEIIITETFPANATKLILSISRILNPSLETFCNTTDVSLLSSTFFRIRVIQIASNAFLFESSAVVDSSNCLRFSSMRIPITLEYSLIMVAGLTYNITYGLTKPASNLKINAFIENQTGFTFSPSMVEFNDYYTLRNTTTLYLRSDIPAGTYTIKFNKYESELKTYFRNILPITITVIKAEQTSLSKPTITVQSMSVSTIGYAVDIPVVFSMPSSTEMTLFMTIAEESNQTLEKYSEAFKDFTITPKIINIKPQASSYSFQIQHMQKVVPPPLTLSFKLTSLYPIIHELTTQRLYVCFDQDPKFDLLEPPMRIRVTAFLASCSNRDVGKPITNIKVSDSFSTASRTVTTVRPVIVSVDPKQLLSTSAVIQVSLDAVATVYYLCQPSGSPAVTDNEVIKAMNSTIGFKGMTTSNPMSIYSGTSSQINFKATIEINKLSPSLDYDIYVISESALGQSSIMMKSFKTTDLSKGVVMRLSFRSIVDSLTIVKALERILRISPMRIKVLTSTFELQLLQSSINQNKNNPYYVYEVVIAPDPVNDIKSPEQIVKDFINNTSYNDQLKSEISEWANNVPVTYYELKVFKPRVLELPKPVTIHTYNCTFRIKMWQRSNIFAVLIQEPGKAANTLKITQQPIIPVRVSSLNTSERAKVPKSSQIRSGLTKENKPLNKYRYYSGTTDQDGIGNIFFDDLIPGTKYTMFITSSSILPYEPSFLWDDNQVIKVGFTTLYSQALHNQEINTNQLRKYNPSLAAAIEKFQNNQNRKGDFGKLTKQ